MNPLKLQTGRRIAISSAAVIAVALLMLRLIPEADQLLKNPHSTR
jgi:hypothetical protein